MQHYITHKTTANETPQKQITLRNAPAATTQQL